MNQQIVLDPGLGVSAGEFAGAWNEQPECRALARAEASAGGAQAYDPALAEMVNLILVPLMVGVAANMVYDGIKMALLQAGVRRRTRIIRVKQRDGSELTIITVDEEG